MSETIQTSELQRRLRHGWQSTAELASVLRLSKRTVHRLIDALRASGVTIERRRRSGTNEAEFRIPL